MSSNKQFVHIFSGIPGSGKSYLAKGLAEQTGAVLVSADHFFEDPITKEYKFDFTKLGQAHATCMKKFREALASGKSVIVDNTNTSVFEVSPYILVAQSYDVWDIKITTIQVNDEDVERAHARNTHGVPLGGVQAMHARLKERVLMPWWEAETIGATF